MTPHLSSAMGITRTSLVFLVWVGVTATLVMGMPGRAMAAVITVNSLADNNDGDGFCTLRKAIVAANGDVPVAGCEASGEFGADTIVFDVNVRSTITLLTALPDITDADGLTIDGATLVAISGDNAVRVFVVEVGASLTLENLTVQNGRANATNGENGGGIFNAGTLTVINSTLTGNSALAPEVGGGRGGGIWNRGTLTITDSTLVDNSATITAGGIFNFSGEADVINSTLAGNSAYSTGGIFNGEDGKFTVTNSTLSGNSAIGFSGGLFNWGEFTITHSTLAGNSADRVGGIVNIQEGRLTITNSLLANGPEGLNCLNNVYPAGRFTATGNNMATDSSCLGVPEVAEAALNLGPLADNGGPTKTHALLTGSVAINAGDPSLCETTDQRGVLRDALCDIGAFEFNEGIQDLIDLVREIVPTRNAAGLIAKLQAALAAQSDGRTGPACNQMRAFINQVNALVGNETLVPGVGEALITAAQAIRAALGC